ncbi:hypothetical protein M409DRAFT_30237 [Zasmidium cellare ATCC 36951]|uniref:Endo-1,3(4)-beta-glucanase 1 carbohydrate binding domain-containing protein n=1 Tax=Zasmidium cellare ATCC 36951 TaxID=1080233 RepID=A0A6A6C0M9_ZASCE|nr:uncharacterized protein M409DRAFT_30237 [Zasmidium cellare ATCC 36951]KAF2159359.1 hypothetical protein M409DRAFT_30237 [Zasmidium cellare ATCC 36951]
MEALFTLLLFLPFVLSFGHVSARNSSGCPAHYNNETHWCAENSSGSHLCEIVDGMYYSLCGTDRCYNYLQYDCNGITLSEPKKSTSPFYLSVFAPGRDYSFQYIQAAGDQFWVGGNPSTYCPFEDEDPDACAYDSNTVFYSNSLAVTTPGGQRIFIKEDGTLAFTVAHSASEPDAAYDGENVAYSHAGYFGPSGHHWAACRPRGSSGRRRIVADLPGVDLDTEDCEGVFLYVSDLEKGTVGAFEYT